jgi:5-methyltetrahydropteroyltriglutamate--homocysteine methyltransferase
MADTFNYRIDHHGSLVRPLELLAMREKAAAGDLEAEALRAAEDRAIRDVVTYQRKLRSTVVTDGDFPHGDFRDAVLAHVPGFRRTGVSEDGLSRWVAESPPRAEGPLVADRTVGLAELTAIAPKASLPSPAYLAASTFDPELAGADGPASARDLGEALAEIVRAEIGRLVAGGVRLIQLNNPLLLGQVATDAPEANPLSFSDMIAVDAASVANIELPEGVRIGLCPGWTAPSKIDANRAERMYTGIGVHRWILPYDKATAAELDLVRALPTERDLCLGVVDATDPGLEDIEDVLTRVDAAAEVKDIEDMAVAPSRGFADVATRPLLSAEEQRQKLVLVETIARYCWGNEF